MNLVDLAEKNRAELTSKIEEVKTALLKRLKECNALGTEESRYAVTRNIEQYLVTLTIK